MGKENKLSEFIVTARKWRPLKFGDVVGQQHVTVTLKNAIKTGRIHHAYLFSGPRGVGKTTTARILARAVNCENPVDTEPCNKCVSCLSVIEGRSLDVIEIDGASNNSVEDVRKLRENAKYPPVTGKYKMYIIDEVHMLSTSAFNALLKTLEEPPPHLLFVFATTEVHKLPATILSRCQRFEFRRMEIADTVGQLKYIAEQEGINIDEDSLLTIAKKADGSMRDGQSIFDQAVAFCGREIKYSDLADALHLVDQDFYFRITKAVKEKDLQDMFEITRLVVSKGYDLQVVLAGMLEHFRNLLALKVTGETSLIEGSSSYMEQYKKDAEFFEKGDLLRFMNLVSSASQGLKYAPQPRVKFELALLQLASMDTTVEISELINEIKGLKKNLNNGQKSVSVSPSPKPAVNKKTGTGEPKPEVKNTTVETPPAEKAATEPPRKTLEDQPRDTYNEDNSISDPPPAGGTIDAESLKSRWNSFLSEHATAGNGLYILKQAPLQVDFLNGQIILKAENDFVAENLKRSKQKLFDSLERHFGAHVDVKILVGDIEEVNNFFGEPPKPPEINNSNKETSVNSSDEIVSRKADLEGRHPVEQEIIKLFGAEEIPNGRT